MTPPLTLISHKAPPSGESLPRHKCPDLCPECLGRGERVRLDYRAAHFAERGVHGRGVIADRTEGARLDCPECPWFVNIQENDDGE